MNALQRATFELTRATKALHLLACGWRRKGKDSWIPPEDYPSIGRNADRTFEFDHAFNSQKFWSAREQNGTFDPWDEHRVTELVDKGVHEEFTKKYGWKEDPMFVGTKDIVPETDDSAQKWEIFAKPMPSRSKQKKTKSTHARPKKRGKK